MHYLLTNGYRIDKWKWIDIVDRVHEADVGWTLGWMVRATQDSPDPDTGDGSRRGGLIVGLVLLAITIESLLMGFCCYEDRKGRFLYERLGFGQS
jgi:hypothetical protein